MGFSWDMKNMKFISNFPRVEIWYQVVTDKISDALKFFILRLSS